MAKLFTPRIYVAVPIQGVQQSVLIDYHSHVLQYLPNELLVNGNDRSESIVRRTCDSSRVGSSVGPRPRY